MPRLINVIIEQYSTIVLKTYISGLTFFKLFEYWVFFMTGFVRPDLGAHCLQKLSADDTSK